MYQTTSQLNRKTVSQLNREEESKLTKKKVEFNAVSRKLSKIGSDIDLLSQRELDQLKNGS